jgi:succinate dehydrogenase/fumarate reductase-like Fe-S protein
MQLLVDQMKKFVKDIVSSLKQAMQRARSVASSRRRQVQEERSQINRRAREEQALHCVLIALMDKEGQDLEELEAVDSANLIRDLAVDAERVLSDRTDAHMNMFFKKCGKSV